MVQIRQAQTKDAAKLRHYLLRLMSETDHNSPTLPGEFQRTVEEQEKILQAFSNEQNSCYFLAEIDSELVGELNLRGYQRAALQHGCFLGMSVTSQYRRKGIGQALLAQALAWAESLERIERVDLAVLATNIGAIKLYQENGFIEEGRRKHFVKLPSGYVDDILMVKFLK